MQDKLLQLSTSIYEHCLLSEKTVNICRESIIGGCSAASMTCLLGVIQSPINMSRQKSNNFRQWTL